MNTIDIDSARPVHRLPSIALIGALALMFAALATVAAESVASNGGILGVVGDYYAQVGEALAGG